MKQYLSREETLTAWLEERSGKKRWEVAQKNNCCEKTLYRSYKRYGYGSPKRHKASVTKMCTNVSTHEKKSML